MSSEPFDDVSGDFVAVQLVQQFVSIVFIDGEICDDPCTTERGGSDACELTHAGGRVLSTGNHHDRTGDIRHVIDQRSHNTKDINEIAKGERMRIAAQGIFGIEINLGLIPAQPVIGRACRLEGCVVGRKYRRG